MAAQSCQQGERTEMRRDKASQGVDNLGMQGKELLLGVREALDTSLFGSRNPPASSSL